MRRTKKKNSVKIWLPIICIIVVGITFYMIHDMQTKIEKGNSQNIVNNEENEASEENIVTENNIENEVITNNVETENQVSTENVSNTSSKNEVETPVAEAKPAITNKKQKAIELVQEQWGKDSSVNFTFEYVNENGEYVVAVRDGTSATVKNYFRVNLETENVELD